MAPHLRAHISIVYFMVCAIATISSCVCHLRANPFRAVLMSSTANPACTQFTHVSRDWCHRSGTNPPKKPSNLNPYLQVLNAHTHTHVYMQTHMRAHAKPLEDTHSHTYMRAFARAQRVNEHNSSTCTNPVTQPRQVNTSYTSHTHTLSHPQLPFGGERSPPHHTSTGESHKVIKQIDLNGCVAAATVGSRHTVSRARIVIYTHAHSCSASAHT